MKSSSGASRSIGDEPIHYAQLASTGYVGSSRPQRRTTDPPRRFRHGQKLDTDPMPLVPASTRASVAKHSTYMPDVYMSAVVVVIVHHREGAS